MPCVKVLDFVLGGLRAPLSRPGIHSVARYFGTPSCISPEVAKGSPGDARSDVYSLGMVLYEMLSGRPAFAAPSLPALLQMHIREPLRLPPELFTGVPAQFTNLILAMCAKVPSERPSAAEAQRVLGELADVAGLGWEGQRPDEVAQGIAPRGGDENDTKIRRTWRPYSTALRDALPPARGEEMLRATSEVAIKGQTNLVLDLPPILGRNEEVRAIVMSLTGADIAKGEPVRRRGASLAPHRLMTIVGPGGMGKTRLATAAGTAMIPHFPGGVWMCDLSTATTPAALCAAIGVALGVQLTVRNAEEQLTDVLRGRGKGLYILDNCEQATRHVAELVSYWLPLAPDVAILATSREPLHISQEKLLLLEPLALPHAAAATRPARDRHTDAVTGTVPGTGKLRRTAELAGHGHPQRPTTLEEAAASPAVMLFVERAAVARIGFMLDNSNAHDISEIVRRLDGIPLCIKLAAARSGMLRPAAILERLGKRFDLLVSQRRDGARRQRTLRETMEWSWELLTPWERSAAAQLSVFAGGFFLDGGEAVVDLSEWSEAPWPMDVLEALREKSWLHSHQTVDGDIRFSMFSSVHEYSAEKLAAEDTEKPSGTHAQEFRELLGDLVPAEGTSREIKSLAFVFTDLVASTAMYGQLGDAGAYSLVSRHFGVMREIIRDHHGVVVKTIGDAVMAVFAEARDGAAAAIAMQERIGTVSDEASGRTLALTVGLHLGPCIATASGGTVDFFGNTVNVAARVQSQAAGGEITLSEAALAAPGVAVLMLERGETSHGTKRILRGVKGEFRIHRVTVAGVDAGAGVPPARRLALRTDVLDPAAPGADALSRFRNLVSAGGRKAAAERRHWLWYARLGSSDAIDALAFRGGDERRRRLTIEGENVLGAFDRALAAGDLDAVLPLAAVGCTLFGYAGPMPVAADFATRAMAAYANPEDVPARLFEMALRGAYWRHDVDLAEQLARDGLAAAKAQNNEQSAHRCVGLAAEALRMSGFPAKALPQLLEASEQARAAGDEWMVMQMTSWIAEALESLGRAREALPWTDAGLSMSCSRGDTYFRAWMLNGLGKCRHSLGDACGAQAAFEEAGDVAAATSNVHILSLAAAGLSRAALQHGEIARAAGLAQAALDTARFAGSLQHEAVATERLLRVCAVNGDEKRARALAKDGAAAADTVGDGREAAAIQNAFARCMSAFGHDREAVSGATSALALARTAGEVGAACGVLRTRAIAQLHLGDLESAHADLDAAQEIASRMGEGREASELNAEWAEWELASLAASAQSDTRTKLAAGVAERLGAISATCDRDGLTSDAPMRQRLARMRAELAAAGAA